MKRPRDDKGRLAGNTYPESAFLEHVRDGSMPTTGDVAEKVGCDRRTAHDRLTTLEEKGKVESQRVGAALVWAIAD